jgi:hypothetical protein
MKEFGGFGDCNPLPLKAYETPGERLPFAVDVTLPPMSAVFFKKMG